MSYPSVKTLSEITDKPKELRSIIEGNLTEADIEARYPATWKWLQSCYHRPAVRSHIVRMYLADELLGTYGVEGLDLRAGRKCDYCNTGETYDGTLVAIGKPGWFGGFDWSYRVSSWGDIAERFAPMAG